MKAAVYYGPNDIRLENIDSYGIGGKNTYRLKVLSCSVCSYDVRTFRNGNFKVRPPIVLGHEICGELVDEYKSSNLFMRAKTRVSVYPVIPCLKCWYCTNRKFNLCNNLKEIGSTLNGGFAEYIAIPKELFSIGGVVPVPDSISKEQASLIEPLACCINSVDKIKDSGFQSAIIFGDGPIGLMQLMLLKRLSKIRVIVIGKVKHRLHTALKLGADSVLPFNNDRKAVDLIEHVREIQDKVSPNVIFISNNNPYCIKFAMDLVNKNGKIILFSGFRNKNTPQKKQIAIKIDPNFLHYNQISISGSFSSNPADMGKAVNMVKSGEIDLNPLVTHIFPLREIVRAIKAAESFEGVKSVINDFD